MAGLNEENHITGRLPGGPQWEFLRMDDNESPSNQTNIKYNLNNRGKENDQSLHIEHNFKSDGKDVGSIEN